MNVASLLLADHSPLFRVLVLQDLLGRPDSDDEVVELQSLTKHDTLIQPLLSSQREDGSWTRFDLVNTTHRSPLFITSFALIRLGYFGFTDDHPVVKKGISYLMSKQARDGSWSLDKDLRKYFREEDTNFITSLQTSIPLRALSMCKAFDLSQVELAYDWLIEQRIDDGTWPTGYIEGNMRGVGGYRKLAHSQWGCRTNTTSALACLVQHPKYHKSEITRKALDILLANKRFEQHNLGFEIAKLMGAQTNSGLLTFHYEFDLGLIMYLCAKAKVSKTDSRLQDIIAFLNSIRLPNGLWEYNKSISASRYLTYDLLKSMMQLDENSSWFSIEPETSFEKVRRPKERY